MKLLIAGAARDIEKYWLTTQRSLDTIFNSVQEYKCVIVESNSSDNTLSVLNKWAKDDSKRIILSLGNLNEQVRTKRIAQARNTYLKYFKDNNLFDSYDYLLVLDLDDILNITDFS
jgi:glycosyltransferase involved in cell wall biosynthesis